MGVEIITKFVNSFATSFLAISQATGLSAELSKREIKPGVNTTGSCIAGLVGIVGDVRGSATVFLNKQGFSTMVGGMSGGMITADIDSSVAVSVLGEFVNMLCGRVVCAGGFNRVEVTPPQIVVGEDIRNVPAQTHGLKTFTLPFLLIPEGNAFLVLGIQEQ